MFTKVESLGHLINLGATASLQANGTESYSGRPATAASTARVPTNVEGNQGDANMFQACDLQPASIQKSQAQFAVC